MTQATTTIGSGKTGLQYRNEDNDGKKALLNHHKGSSAPSYAEAGIVWLDDTATPWLLKMYDGTDWITIAEVDATNNTVQPYHGTAAPRVLGHAADTGSADTYAVAPSPAATAYAVGQIVTLKPGNANTGAATLNVNSLGAKNIKLPDGSNPVANNLLTSGTYVLVYDGTNFILTNPSGVAGGGLVLQRAFDSESSVVSSTVNIPYDNTVPTSSEGTQILSAVITPESTSNKIHVTVSVPVLAITGSNEPAIVAAFRGTTCIGVGMAYRPDSNDDQTAGVTLSLEDSPATISATTYSVRVGESGSGTLYVNASDTGTSVFSTASKATLLLEEIDGT